VLPIFTISLSHSDLKKDLKKRNDECVQDDDVEKTSWFGRSRVQCA
jgi:hypothetical protein